MTNTAPVKIYTCPTCKGTGKQDDPATSPIIVQDGEGKWKPSAACVTCFGHGSIIVGGETR